MEDKLVSLRTAKLLKDNNFNWLCANYYEYKMENSSIVEVNKIIHNWNSNYVRISRPTQSLAQRWLREKYNMHITINNTICGYNYLIIKINDNTNIIYDSKYEIEFKLILDNYEEVLEHALIIAMSYI